MQRMKIHPASSSTHPLGYRVHVQELPISSDSKGVHTTSAMTTSLEISEGEPK